MKVLRIVGPSDTGTTTLLERLVDRLSDRGRVGTITHVDHDSEIDTDGTGASRHRSAGAARTEAITADGNWLATGDGRTLTGALDDLARTCEYALVEGYGEADLPTVALGDAAVTDPLVVAPSADDVDVDAAVDALEGTESYETLGSLVAEAKSAPAAERAGAIATFTGRVRAKDSPEDTPTEFLEFGRYDEVATRREATLRAELEAREGVHRVLLHHKTGVVDAGEDIVFVVVLAGHRREAFETVADGIDRLKEEVPMFKKEVTVDGTFWAHER
jgi:molybdopterin synthase catalytic subunit